MSVTEKGSVEVQDLFEVHDTLPDEVQALISEYSAILEAGDVDGYEACSDFLRDMQELGYTFDYGLDAAPHSLRVADESDLASVSRGPR